MSFKIPCGGFRLDEESFSLDENGVLSVSGGGGGGVLIVNITNGPEEGLLVADKTIAEIIAAARTQLVFAQYSYVDTSDNDHSYVISGPLARIQTERANGRERTILFFAGCWEDSKEGGIVGGIEGVSVDGVDQWSYSA